MNFIEIPECNIDKIVFHHRGPTVYNDYSYDDLDRVTRADYLVNLQPNIFEAFNMDGLGNRLSTTLRDGSADTYSVDTTSNRYNSIDSAALAYDDAGNLTTDKDGYHTVYDYENRPVRIYKLNGQTQVTVATFDYDALGRRIRKTSYDSVPSVATLYYYSDNWQVLAEYNGSGTVQKTFVFGNYIDEVLVMTNYQPLTTNDYYYLHDHLYSPAALLNSSGSVVERYEYDAYGTCRILTPGFGLLTSSQYGNSYTFTGRELDNFDIVGGTPGLTKMHYRHRDYSMFMGRFYQHDPMQYVDGLNFYEYVRNNPLLMYDFMGLWGGNVHNGYTSRWARGGTVGFTHGAAKSIGENDEAVDSGQTGPLPGDVPIFGGNQAYHFNAYHWSSENKGSDTRLELFEKHFAEAKRLCRKDIDLPEDSVKQLGTALHPLQDWVAHADHGMRELVGLYWVHNAKSPQNQHGSPDGYPDDVDLDVRGVSDGRAVESVLVFINSTGGRQSDYAYYERGHKRITLTRKLTTNALVDFRGFLIAEGGCKCKKFYL